MSPLVRSLLERRGLVDDAAIEAFLHPDYDFHTHEPFLIEGMKTAVTRLLHAIEQGERIAVYADFDCDGIPGAAVLSDFFERIGYTNVEVYIPHRDREGYGFHEDAIQELAKRGAALIITVDVGTTAVAQVAFAKKHGVDVIVTDHHEIIGELPDAVAVLNPKLGEYPFRHLCGAAVAFKLVQAALQEGKRHEMPAFKTIPSGWEKWLLDLVGIATVADMVPLSGENRVLAYYGLQVLRKSPRPGIRALCEKLRLRQNALTEDDIGFSIAPRINAASRMDEPRVAFELLTTRDPVAARARAEYLEELNASRKGVVAGIVKKAKKVVASRYLEGDSVVVVGDPEWKPALLGLAANSVMNERGGVVCVWGRDANGKLKGSCRSDGSISLVDLFGAAKEHLDEAGGHERSGGFSVSHEKVHTLASALKEVAASLSRKDSGAVEADARLPLFQVSGTLLNDISRLAPFGVGNPKPIFHIEDTSVVSVKRFGKTQDHVEVEISCKKSGVRMRAFEFFRSPKDFSHVPSVGNAAALTATIERDTYRGGIALRIVDIIKPSVA